MQKLTREQLFALFDRLNNAGCPVERDHGYKVPPRGLAIEKFPGMTHDEIFDLEQGGTGYAIEFFLRNELDRPIDIQGLQIKTPWGIPRLSLVPAPRKSSAKWPHYTFPEPGRYYDGDFVINRLFARRKSRLNPGEEIEGVLIASSEETLPLEVKDGAHIIVTLTIFDTRGNSFSTQFTMPVNRSALIIRERKNQVWASGRLKYARHV